MFDELGAAVAVEIAPKGDGGWTRTQQRDLKRKLQGCQGCGRSDGASWFVDGKFDAEWGMVVDGTMKKRDLALMKLMCRETGLGDGKTLRPVACGGDAVTHDDITACRGNFWWQMGDTRNWLLVGATGVNLFRGDLQVSKQAGMVFVWDGVAAVMVVNHPGVLKLKGGRQAKRDMKKALEVFRGIVDGERKVLEEVGRVCVWCGGEVREIDEDGVGYCTMHWKNGGDGRRMEAQERWVVETENVQGVML